MQTSVNSSSTTTPISRYLVGGLIAGLTSAVVSIIYNYIYQAATGNSYAELNIGTILVIALLTSLIGGMAYYGLTRLTRQPLPIFWAVGLIFATLSVIPNFVIPPNPAPGFATASSPMHFIVALACLIIVPFWVKRQA